MFNVYFYLILVTLVVSNILSTTASVLNLKYLSPQIPDEFKDIFDEKKYSDSQKYTKVNTVFSLIENYFGLFVFLIFWFFGGFNSLDVFVRSFGFSEIFSGLMYIGILSVANTLIGLPFSIYSVFVIEEKFGFNKTTPATFITDLIKQLILSVMIGGIILYLILFIFEKTGAYAWLGAWIATTVITFFIQALAPTLILPLFNKFTPLEDGELRTEIEKVAEKANFPLGGIYVIDGSKRSAKSNAFFTGFGKTKRIALYDTLIEQHTVPELVAVLAHEIGHYKKRHIIKNMIMSVLQIGFAFAFMSLFLKNRGLFDAFGMEHMSVYAGLLFFGLLYSPVSLIVSVIFNMLSRKYEFEADAFAAKLIDNKNDMISALKKLSANNLSNLTPHPFYVFLNYSHPPVLQRIEHIRKIEK